MSASQVAVHTTEIDVTNLPTRSVTFAPTRATVTRALEGIRTEIGANEVIITGLDPNIDTDSVRVDGYGLATITDIQAEVVPRKEQFEDQYPDHEEFNDNESDEDILALADESYGVDKTAVDNAKKELQSAEAALASSRNSQDTAVKVLQYLDQYGQSLKAHEVDVAKMADFLSVYRSQRISESERHQQASTDIAMWQEKVEVARGKLTLAESALKKAKDAASRDVRREQEKRARKKHQERLQKHRIIQQRRRFWSNNTSQVVVYLDRTSASTLSSSRRNSTASAAENSLDYVPSKPLDEDCVNLLLTYVVPNAKWVPRYELKISTPKSSADLVYRAEFENHTSEIWKNAKVTFSTSQTFFSGLEDKIPVLDPWHVKLGIAIGSETKDGISTSSIQSKKEILANTKSQSNSLFKSSSAKGATGHSDLFSVPPPPPPAAGAGGVAARRAPAPLPPPPQPFAREVPSQALFGAATASVPRYRRAPRRAVNPQPDVEEDWDSEDDADAQTLDPEASLIAHQDSHRQDYGLTTTYDLPGQRTVEPSTVKRRHVISELHLASITLSHVLIPKLRRAAFLKARMSNTTAFSLLRGKAGMTVDGTFLGSTTLPNCEPGHFVDLSLGVDPSILVTYAKPTARRSTAGFFSKEDSAIFTRSCWIKNTKKNDVSITVYDQVPVSEDEQLRINILEPKGLDKEDEVVKLYDPFKNGEKGTGEVVWEKGGRVKWNIKLRSGKDVRLILEYESRIPSGKQIVGLD
ncbi:hypothetical protein UA08_00412 [Talaromyces atroroseus]|uniref:DUF4139 domain-containing protein n=1 Tax=Talaromyces atroroseus TaxID=1441469 RepID=A0A225AQB1_TALAT|nr:hypothetical protein UA08_00412 [Talaromyces atroroseus]OKL63811.1 hypothetical protein UA08_00412 [Talaromyces atroroseus]